MIGTYVLPFQPKSLMCSGTTSTRLVSSTPSSLQCLCVFSQRDCRPSHVVNHNAMETGELSMSGKNRKNITQFFFYVNKYLVQIFPFVRTLAENRSYT